MRIISGKYRGRRITPGKNFKARPTTDFAKESLFNIISNEYDIEGLSVLDLFAGTGGISYEFASRGCTEIDVVEKDRNHYRFIQEMCKSLSIEGAKLYNMDTFKFLERVKKKYDIIFADPPYEHKRIIELPDLMLSNDLLNDTGEIIIEHSSKTDFTLHHNFDNSRKYGSVNFSFFKK